MEFSKVAPEIQRFVDKQESSASYIAEYVVAWRKFQNWGNVLCENDEMITGREEAIGWDAVIKVVAGKVGNRYVPNWPVALKILDWIQKAQKEVKARKVKEGVRLPEFEQFLCF